MSLNQSVKDLFNSFKSWDGHSWCISHWGTKWDIYDTVANVENHGERIEYGFDTAWSPPINWVVDVASRFPALDFELVYFEGGVGFAGRFRCENGDIVEDMNFEGSGEDVRNFVVDVFGYDSYEIFDGEEE